MPVRIIDKEQGFIDWAISDQDGVVAKLRPQLALEGPVDPTPDDLPPGGTDVADSNSNESLDHQQMRAQGL